MVVNPLDQTPRQILVGEIHRRLGPGQCRQQVAAPGFALPAEGAVELAQGLAALGRGLGLHQVGDGFGLGQVELAVVEGLAGEIPGPAGLSPGTSVSA